MSSKKNPQKPASQKPDAEPVSDLIETAADAPAEDAAAEATPEAAEIQPDSGPSAEAGDQNPAPEAHDEPQGDADDDGQSPEAEDAAEPVAIVPAAAPSQPDPLSIRLSRAVNGLLTGGKPEDVQALHKLEMSVGDLKNALPAAIAATGDDQFKAELISLLAVL
jgi:hypothetical protein